MAQAQPEPLVEKGWRFLLNVKVTCFLGNSVILAIQVVKNRVLITYSATCSTFAADRKAKETTSLTLWRKHNPLMWPNHLGLV